MEPWKWIAVAVAILVGGFLLVSMLTPPKPVIEEVSFANGEITLAGTLTLPPKAGPHPAVILISGSGPQNRDEELPIVPGYQPFRLIAEHLTKNGIAVLRYDDRGVGESTGDYATATSADFATDAEAALSYLLSRDEIDPDQVGMLGHSEGAIIAAMIAARNPKVAFVISMAGPAVDGYNVLLVQLERVVRAEGGSEDEVAEAAEDQRITLDLAMAEEWEELEAFLLETYREGLQALSEEEKAAIGDLEVAAQQRAASSLANLQSPWFQFFLSYDPGQDWEQTTVPVLALFGELDVQADVSQNQPALEAALASAGNTDVTVVVFPTANHLFQDAVTGAVSEYATLPTEFVPGFLEAITDWLLERVSM